MFDNRNVGTNLVLMFTFLIVCLFFSSGIVNAGEIEKGESLNLASGESPGNKPESIYDYFPQKKGDEWTYWYIMKEGKEGGSLEVKMVVLGKEKVNDVECTVTGMKVKDKIVSKNYFQVTDKKVTMYRQVHPDGKIVDYEPPAVIFQYPPKKGMKWVNPSKLNNFDTTFTVVGEEDVALPIGKVKAWRIKSGTTYSKDEKVGGEGWYAKGIGMVNQRFFGEKGDRKSETTMSLKAYKIDGKDSNKIIGDSIKSLKNANKEIMEYLPLKIGSKWLYSDVTFDHEGKKIAHEVLYEITGTQQYKGKECIILFRLLDKQPMIAAKDLYIIEGDKVYSYGSKAIMTGKEKPDMVMQVPFKPGNKWVNEDEKRVTEYTVVGEVMVKVPAGTFKAWKVKGISKSKKGIKQSSDISVWYVRGIGVVKTYATAKAEIDSKVLEFKNDMELLEYKIPEE